MHRMQQSQYNRRAGFTLRDMLVAILVIGVLLALLIPSIQSAREAARNNVCISQLKGYGLAMHNYHDINKCFPSLTTTKIRGVRPGSFVPDGKSAGFSWRVMCLPYLEDQALYDEIKLRSSNFSRPAFDPAISWKSPSGLTPYHAATRVITESICPSYRGAMLSNAKEYATVVSNNLSSDDGTGFHWRPTPNSNVAEKRCGVAVSNYVALTATHADLVLKTSNTEPNGSILPDRGTKLNSDFTDGSSRTLMIAESIEPRYASWYDGTVGWTAAANPNGQQPVIDGNGYWRTDGNSALNIGPHRAPFAPYLSAVTHGSISQDWRWGPSSQHAGDVVNHLIADGSARGITEEIDSTLYLQWVTRAGGEKVGQPE
jgi:type II secretory pathway pseudopilin PulG